MISGCLLLFAPLARTRLLPSPAATYRRSLQIYLSSFCSTSSGFLSVCLQRLMIIFSEARDEPAAAFIVTQTDTPRSKYLLVFVLNIFFSSRIPSIAFTLALTSRILCSRRISSLSNWTWNNRTGLLVVETVKRYSRLGSERRKDALMKMKYFSAQATGFLEARTPLSRILFWRGRSLWNRYLLQSSGAQNVDTIWPSIWISIRRKKTGIWTLDPWSYYLTI